MRFVVTTDHLAPSERPDFWHSMLVAGAGTDPVADSCGGAPRAITSANLNLVVTDNETVDVARTPSTIRKGDAARRGASATSAGRPPDQTCRQVPIRLIARRWGFPDASHFTRAYKGVRAEPVG